MAKYKQKKSYVGYMALAALLVLATLGYFFSQAGSIAGGAGGATVFSIDDVSVKGASLDQTEWVIALSMNDGAESVVGEIDANTLAQYNLDTLPVSAFKIEFDLQNPVCRYDIAKDPNVVGEIYYQFVTEQCLANVCPYGAIDLDDVINHCQNGGGATQIPGLSGENCERMVDLIDLGGAYTEWCYWLPEESNQDAPGECRDSVIDQEITVTNTPAGCGRFTETLTTITTSINEGETGGDWQVMHAGIVPQYDIYRISSATQFGYDAVVKVTMTETGEELECIIDPVTKSCDLGDFGQVEFAGNLLADQSCPIPGVDTQLLRDVDTQNWSSVDGGIGSSLASYLTSLNQLKQQNVDYYTFTAVPEEETTINSQTITQFACDPAVGNPLFPFITGANNLAKNIPNEAPPDFGYTCEVVDGKYECDTGASVVYPLLKLTVKAAKVGVYVPDGQPDIQGIALTPQNARVNDFTESIELLPGKLSKLYVGVKNIGEEDDSFDVSLSCPFPITQISKRLVVTSGNTEVAELQVSGDGLIQNCEAKATSVSYPSNQDTDEVKVIINPSCDQYGIDPENLVFTEFGCYARTPQPNPPCANNEFWLSSLEECVDESEAATPEAREALLARVAQENCNDQCEGNSQCTLSCLENGNVKPVCTGIGKQMKLNDYLCDFDNNPQIYQPQDLQGKVWLDAPICNYVCEYGKSGTQCDEVAQDVSFNFGSIPTLANLVPASATCQTCFDGIQNGDETGIDCGGTCEATYGLDKSCNKLRAPDFCFNHVQDGDEEGRDCGGSCDFACEDIIQSYSPGNTLSNPSFVFIVLLVVVLVAAMIVYYVRKKMK